MLVDLRYIPVESTGERLWNSHVSQGVFTTMFGSFQKIGGQIPFGTSASTSMFYKIEAEPEFFVDADYILKVVSMITASNGNIPTDVHLTVFSLLQ